VTDDELPPGGEVLDEDPLRYGWRPEEIARLLAGVPVPWYVASGWLPHLVPEIVLLFKAKHARPKDEKDMRGTLPLLDQAARGWLGWARRRVHPGHRWIEMLEPE
jgi:hypothetical protein